MAKGTVGKLGVKVIPDLSRFASELKKKLRQIKRQVGKLEIEFTADIDVDDTSLKKAQEKVRKSDTRLPVEPDLPVSSLAALKSKLRDLKAELKVNPNLSDSDKKRIEQRLEDIRTNVHLSVGRGDLAKLTRDVKGAASDIQAQLKLNKRSVADIQQKLKSIKSEASVSAKLDKSTQAAIKKQLSDIRSVVDVHPHLSEEQKKKIKHELNKLEGKATVNVDLDDGKARFDLKRLTRSRWVSINVRLGKASVARVAAQLKALAGGNVFESIGRNLNDFLRNLDTAAVKIGTVSTLIGSAVSVIGSGLGVFSSLSVGLAKSTPALLALPGIFGAAAAGVGVLITALKDAKTVLSDLGPAFTNLQSQISASYWEQAAQPIRNFANVAIQELSPALQSVAANLGSMTAAIATAAGGHIQGFHQSLTYLSQALSIGSTGAASFTNGLLTMGEVGAKFLPSITRWANDLAASFEAWATKAAASGRMEESIRAAAKAFGTLKDITVDLGGIIGGLFKAMANGSAPIDSIATALDRANKAVNGPLFQSTLTNLFSSMSEAAGKAFQGVGALGQAFVTLEPTLGRILPMIGETLKTALEGIAAALENPAFRQGLVEFFNGLLVAVQALAPAMPALGEAFGAIASVAGTLLAAIAPLVAELVEQLAPILQQIAPLLTPIIEQLATFLMPVIQALAPVIGELLVQLAPLVSDILQAILPLLLPIIQSLSEALIPTIQVCAAVIQALLPVVKTTFGWVRDFIVSILDGLKGFMNVIMGLIEGDWGRVWLGIKQLASAAWNFLRSAFMMTFGAIWEFAKWVWGAIKDWIWQKITDIWNGIKNWLSNVSSSFSRGWSDVQSMTRAAWSALVSAIGNFINNAVNTVRNMPRNIKNIFSNAGSWLWNAGKSIINGLLDGINSMFSSVKNKLNSLTNMLPSWKGPAPVDRVILKDAGRLVMQGFINGLESQYDAVRDSLEDFTDTLSHDVAPEISATVSGNYEKAVKRQFGNVDLGGAHGDGRPTSAGTTVNIVNNYPQAQRDSKTRDDVADAIRLASSI